MVVLVAMGIEKDFIAPSGSMRKFMRRVNCGSGEGGLVLLLLLVSSSSSSDESKSMIKLFAVIGVGGGRASFLGWTRPSYDVGAGAKDAVVVGSIGARRFVMGLGGRANISILSPSPIWYEPTVLSSNSRIPLYVRLCAVVLMLVCLNTLSFRAEIRSKVLMAIFTASVWILITTIIALRSSRAGDCAGAGADAVVGAGAGAGAIAGVEAEDGISVCEVAGNDIAACIDARACVCGWVGATARLEEEGLLWVWWAWLCFDFFAFLCTEEHGPGWAGWDIRLTDGCMTDGVLVCCCCWVFWAVGDEWGCCVERWAGLEACWEPTLPGVLGIVVVTGAEGGTTGEGAGWK